MRYRGVVLVVLIFLVSVPALSQDRWGSDYLIGNFPEGIVSTGNGYSNFDCLYGSSEDVFVCFIEHTSETGIGDILTLRKSLDNGLSWTWEQTISGGDNPLFSPSLSRLPWNGNVLITRNSHIGSSSTTFQGYEFDYSTLNLVQVVGEIEFAYPGAGLIRSTFTVSNSAANEVWFFIEDENDWLFLTKTSDFSSWSSATPVAVNVSRASAVVSSDGKVAVSWMQPITGDLMCSVSDISGNFQPALIVTANSAASATPILGWEHIGDSYLGVVWHDDAGESFLTISEDQGTSWGDAEFIGEGIYPFINSYPGTKRMGVCYTTPEGDMKVASAANLSTVPIAPYTTRSNHEAYLEGPAKVLYGEDSNQLALFFLSPSTEDFWYNNSQFTSGIEESGEASHLTISAGPNPANGSFAVSTSGFSGDVQYSLYNLDGRLIEISAFMAGDFVVNAGSLPAGVYTVVASGGELGETATCRVVKF